MSTASVRVSSLREVLLGPDDALACQAARDLARMRSRARDAVDDLIAAATLPWKFGCPQRFADSIRALLKIAPEDARLVPVIRDTIWCSNYGIQKTCVLALLDIGTGEAIQTIYNIYRYWRASPKSPPFRKLMHQVLGKIKERGLDKLVPNPQRESAGLVAWLEGHRQGPPCPQCGHPLRTQHAKQCFECGFDWHGSENGQYSQV
jgi:hypothetical protein